MSEVSEILDLLGSLGISWAAPVIEGKDIAAIAFDAANSSLR
jgi:hypothetical protein